MPTKPTDTSYFPDSGPGLDFLRFLYNLREVQPERPSLGRILQSVHLSERTSLNDILRGKRPPVSRLQVEEIVTGIGGQQKERDEAVRLWRAWVSIDGVAPPRGPKPKVAAVTDPAVPAQLPGPVAGFVGREAELAELDAWLRSDGNTLLVCGVDGMAGVGKTMLVRRWAATAKDAFPDGQLYVDLRGFDPSSKPLRSRDALAALLEPLLDGRLLPKSEAGRSAMFRTALSRKKMLVVLDNALNEEQVRPILPGGTMCATIITSRKNLAGLEITESAQHVAVGLMSPEESRIIFENKVGIERTEEYPEAVDRLIRYCGRLPLALSIVGAGAAQRPAMSLDAVADEIESKLAHGDLTSFDIGGDPHGRLAAAFSWSYDKLRPETARTFRLLALSPARQFALRAAASLTGNSMRTTQGILRHLVAANLVEEPEDGRYQLHNLLGAYGLALAETEDTRAARTAAKHRLIAYYLHSAHAGASSLFPLTIPVNLGAPRGDIEAEDLSDYDGAFSWFEQEREALPKIIQLAADEADPEGAWKLAWTCQDYYRRRGLWGEWAETHRVALEAAIAADDAEGIARIRDGLGRAHMWAGDYDHAERELRAALSLFTHLGDQDGVANAYLDIATMYENQEDYASAIVNANASLEIAREINSKIALAKALNNTGWSYILNGEPQTGIPLCLEGLELHRAMGNKRGEYNTLDSLGLAYLDLDDTVNARKYFAEALTLHVRMQDRWARAMTLMHMGDLEVVEQSDGEARDWYRQAETIFEELGHAKLAVVREKLSALDQSRSA